MLSLVRSQPLQPAMLFGANCHLNLCLFLLLCRQAPGMCCNWCNSSNGSSSLDCASSVAASVGN